MENQIKELRLEDLISTTWDYRKNDLIGRYKNIPIRVYLFRVKAYKCDTESTKRHLLTVQGCNVKEGWIEFIEVEGPPVKINYGQEIFPGKPKVENDEIVRTKVKCSKIEVDILDTEENVIETILRGN